MTKLVTEQKRVGGVNAEVERQEMEEEEEEEEEEAEENRIGTYVLMV